MNHKLAFIAVALALFTFGCNQQNEQDVQTDAAAPATTDHDHGEDAHTEEGGASTTTVTLDNGQRWKANPETTSGIANMVALIEKQTTEPGDPEALKSALEEEFALIFERCTMTGEAHNQLHNYLIPVNDRLRELDPSRPEDLVALKSYLSTYGNYFE